MLADDTEQANIVLGSARLSRVTTRGGSRVGVLSAALGGGMSSRLFQQIRERARTGLLGLLVQQHATPTTGQFGVYAGCQPGKADEVLGLIRDELDAVAAGGLTAAEIERGKGQMRGGIVLGLEDSGSRMTRIGKSELVYGDVLGVDELLGHDRRGDRRATSPRWPPSCSAGPRCLTVVGPFGEHDFDGAV